MAITQKQVKGIKFQDFDPNNFQEQQEVWGLFDGSRFRTFGARPAALSATMNQHRAKLYWMTPAGTWREVAVKDGDDARGRPCDWCGSPPPTSWNWSTSFRWVWEKFSGKIPPGPDGVKLLYLCSTCRSVNG